MLEVTVKRHGMQFGTAADVVRLVKGTTAQLQRRLKILVCLLKEY